MTNPLYDKLSFNGFNVTVWNHETRCVEEKQFPTYDSVIARGFTKDGDAFPDAETFAEGLFNVYGDQVGMIKDNLGNVLLDDMVQMNMIANQIY